MLLFQVSNKCTRQQFEHPEGPIEFGRGPRRDSTPRCVIQEDLYVSKDHVRIEESASGKVQIENLSGRNPIWLADNTSLAPGSKSALDLPIRLTVGETLIDISQAGQQSSYDALATIQKPVRSSRISMGVQPLSQLGDSPNAETLAHWFETVITVQRAAAGSPEFYGQTAQALVDLVGLDRGMVLLLRDQGWEVAASYDTAGSEERGFSQTILKQVLTERRTFYQSAVAAPLLNSLRGVEAVVASPIFGAQDQIVGAVYGIRTRQAAAGDAGIGPLEAQIVQLLASAAGVGLARQEQEAEAGRLRVQFEQFFSSSLARELERNPRLLEGQEREVTVLFCDIRGFSRLAERLGPHDTCRLIGDALGEITEQVREKEGVVVDYAGDGLMAMWNAPADQPDHAARACQAALAILKALPRVSEAWASSLGGPLGVGIGINTGPALVGNIGSAQKFKYGPLGHTVNLASRVEGATKQLGIPVLVTGSTCKLAGSQFPMRRLCRVRAVGMTTPVDLHELYTQPSTPEWVLQRDAYEKALALYEAGQWPACCRAIYPLLEMREGNHDISSLNLLTRAIECLKAPPRSFDPVIDFTAK
jgi:adenylate cyclase